MPTTSTLTGCTNQLRGTLPTLKVLCCGRNSVRHARVLLDSGAENSFISKQFAETLQLPVIDNVNLNLCGITGHVTNLCNSVVECKLQSILNIDVKMSCKFQILDVICNELPGLDIGEDVLHEQDLSELTEKLPRPSVNVDILVGQDYFANFFPPNSTLETRNNLQLWKTKFGLAISGRVQEKVSLNVLTDLDYENSLTNVSNTNMHEHDEFSNLLHKFWDLETLGIKDDISILSPDKTFSLKHFNDHIKCTGDSYITMWTDNSANLHWIKKPPSNWKTFVGNRVAQIQQLFPDTNIWHFCPTDLNVADKASRGVSSQTLVCDKEWFFGPKFLYEPENKWPRLPSPAPSVDISLEAQTVTLVQTAVTNDLMDSIFLNTKPFAVSLNVLTWVVKFVAMCRKQGSKSNALSRQDYLAAMATWTQFVKRKYFADEMKCITKNNTLLPTSKLNQLCPFIDKRGLLLVGGRLSSTESLPEQERCPPIIPKNAVEVEQFVMHTHVTWGHIGPELTLHKIRKNFWILGGRREIKRIIARCKCYKLRAKPFQQKMAPLPDFKTNVCVAFNVTGVDFFGPIKVTLSSKNPVEMKIFGVIFSCMTSRACHLETVLDATTQEFLFAVKRFMCEKGYCRKFVSDNAKQFHKADRQLQALYKSLDWKRIERENLHVPEPIEWQFNNPLAPWWGGSFERKIGAVKKSLRSTLANRNAKLTEFYKLWKLARVEAVHRGRDNLVRSVDLFLSPGQRFKRPVQNLFKLEADDGGFSEDAPPSLVA